jgi:hypothetical protein
MMILIAVGSHRMRTGVAVICRVSDAGTFTVPASTFALIPPAFDQAVVAVTRVAETVTSAGGARVTIEVTSSIASGPFRISADDDATARANAAVARFPIRRETTPQLYMSVAIGRGGVSRIGDVPPSAGVSGRLQFGQRLRHGLHLVEEVSFLGGNYISPYAIGASEMDTPIGAGVRWTPFEPRPERSGGLLSLFPGQFVDITAFYLTAVVGADYRDRFTQTFVTQSTNATSWSPMASLALGLLEIQGHDWSLGPEFREQLASFDGHLQLGWLAMLTMHLNRP